jgi:hypothetical protein
VNLAAAIAGFAISGNARRANSHAKRAEIVSHRLDAFLMRSRSILTPL